MRRRKFWDIDHPPVVVIVGDDDRGSDVAATLGDVTDYRVEREPTADEAIERLDRNPVVECFWTADQLPDATGIELTAAVKERDPPVSVVFAASASDDRLAAAATAAGATDYVHASASIETHVERIRTAVERAIERRNRAEKSDVLDSMFAEFDVSLYVKDDRARHVLVTENPTNPEAEEAFGKTDPELYHEEMELFQESYRDDLRVIETGTPVYDRVERFTGGQDHEWLWTTKVPWQTGGRTKGLIGITRDVTRFKRREYELLRQLARLQDVPDFLGHDLKNPLAIATGYAELAREGDTDALDVVVEELERMEELLDDFHALATQDLGTAGTRNPVHLEAQVEKVWEYVDDGTSALEIRVDPAMTIVANESQLRPLLKNLFANAITHVGPGVTVRVGALEDGFYVEDDGPGIPPERRDEVFEQGYTTAAEGSGLGLSIVDEVVTSHDWRCEIVEGTDGGARFEIRNCLAGTQPSAVAGARLELTEATDVGDVRVPGSSVREESSEGDGSSFVVEGAGDNIWDRTNQFHFRYTVVDGGVRIQGRLVDLDPVSEYSKAGFMVRSGLDEDAGYGFVGATVDDVPELLWRTESGRAGTSHQFTRAAHDYDWYRLERIGEQVYCSVSTDGESWDVIDQRWVALDDPVAVGIAVCSVNRGEVCRARFDDVSVTEMRAREE